MTTITSPWGQPTGTLCNKRGRNDIRLCGQNDWRIFFLVLPTPARSAGHQSAGIERALVEAIVLMKWRNHSRDQKLRTSEFVVRVAT